ncbi:MAG: hypothetical protein O3B64_03615 [bacterium]|nr:hypothetical protein [bacterium]
MKMPILKKTVNHYETFLRRAFKTAHDHKELWFLAFLASFAAGGSILLPVLRQMMQIRPATEFNAETVNNLLGSDSLATVLSKNLLTLGPSDLAIRISAGIILILAFVVMVIGAQHILVNAVWRAAKRQKKLTLAELFHEVHHLHFWRLIAANALVILSSLIVIGIGTLFVSYVLTDNVLLNYLVYLLVYAALLPVLLGINIVGMTAIIHLVREDATLPESYRFGVHMLRNHWLTTTELSILILFVNIFAFLAVLLIALVEIVLMMTVFYAVILSGSTILVSFVGALTAIIVLATIIAMSGFVVTFNYSAWIWMMRHLDRYHIQPVLHRAVQFATKPFMR